VYHTDNGNEVHAKEVLTAICQLNPLCYTVTGGVCKPNEQGSVERANRTIKESISNVVHEQRRNGKPNASWVSTYPMVMASINATSNKGVGEVASYEAVFGMAYHEPLQSLLGEALLRSVPRTVEDMAKHAGSDYKAKMKFLGLLADDALSVPGSSQRTIDMLPSLFDEVSTCLLAGSNSCCFRVSDGANTDTMMIH